MTMQAPSVRRVTRTVLLTIYSLIVLVPLTVVFFTTLKTSQQMYVSPFGLPTSPTLGNVTELLDGGGLATSLLNSVVVTLSSVVLTLLISSLAAYGIARIHGWLGIAVFGFVRTRSRGARPGGDDSAVRQLQADRADQFTSALC